MQIASVYVSCIARWTERGRKERGGERKEVRKDSKVSFFFFSLLVLTRSRLHSSRLPSCADRACDTPSDSAGKGQQDKHMASGIMGVKLTASTFFFVCMCSPPLDPAPPLLPPPLRLGLLNHWEFLQVAGKVTSGLVCQNNSEPICPVIVLKAVFRPGDTTFSEPSTLRPTTTASSTDICSGGANGLISLGSE